MKLLQIHIIFGPTASGKGKLAIGLWEKFGFPLLSVDSRKVYKEANIGTNKLITLNFMRQNPTALVGGLDLIEPDKKISVYQYQQYAYEWLTQHENEIRKAGGLVMHGGTGLYFGAVLKGLSLYSAANEELRKELATLSLEELQKRAEKVNPARFLQLNESDRANPRRLIRVIENASQRESDEGRIEQHHIFKDANLVTYPMATDREALYEAMNKRVYRYLEEGWLEEVDQMRKKWGDDVPALQMMGYKQLVLFIQQHEDWREQAHENNNTFQQVVGSIQQEHRRYAKRQITWGKRSE